MRLAENASTSTSTVTSPRKFKAVASPTLGVVGPTVNCAGVCEKAIAERLTASSTIWFDGVARFVALQEQISRKLKDAPSRAKVSVRDSMASSRSLITFSRTMRSAYMSLLLTW